MAVNLSKCVSQTVITPACAQVFDLPSDLDIGFTRNDNFKLRIPEPAFPCDLDFIFLWFARASTRLLAAAILRNVLGMRNLAQILSDREAISRMIQTNLDVATDAWGVDVERVEIKDVRLPAQLQRAMAAEAEADREAKAKIIVAQGEIKASKALKEASIILVDNPMALQLRYLQCLNTISTEKESTIVFPFPMDYIKTFIEPEPGSAPLRTKY